MLSYVAHKKKIELAVAILMCVARDTSAIAVATKGLSLG
jgi:hypothetical protein